MLDIPTAANLGGHVGPARGREGPPEGGSGRRREGRVRQEEGSTGGRGEAGDVGGGWWQGFRLWVERETTKIAFYVPAAAEPLGIGSLPRIYVPP